MGNTEHRRDSDDDLATFSDDAAGEITLYHTRIYN